MIARRISAGRWVSLLAFVGLFLPAHADDGAIAGVGGSIRLMGGHPSVRMESEHVKITFSESRYKVVADFVFVNDGPEVTVKMGFPESGNHVKPEPTNFISFKSWLDGKSVRTKREVGSFDKEGNVYEIWWTKTVSFSKGQTRRVRVEYGAPPGGSTSYEAWATYVLSTGSSWKGTIGRAVVEVDLSGLKDHSGIKFEPEPTRRLGDAAVWDYRDLEPNEDYDITIHWFYGFLNIFVDGNRVLEEDSWGHDDPPQFEYGIVPNSWGEPPMLRSGDIEASARTVAAWLHAKLHNVKKTRAWRFEGVQGRFAAVRLGSDSILTNRGTIKAPFKARMDSFSCLRVPLLTIAKALGATVSKDLSPRKVSMRLAHP